MDKLAAVRRRLGKRFVKKDSRTLQLSKYLLKLGAVLPPAASEVSWDMRVPAWPMMLNDNLGDCTIAAAGHMIQQWTRYASSMVVPSDLDILNAYEAVGGYVPGHPETDGGCFMLDVLNYWRKVGIGGHTIIAYAQVDFTNDLEMRQAIELFGNVYFGVSLPLSVQGMGDWTVPDQGYAGEGLPGSWGGHCIPIMASSPYTDTCVSWASLLKQSHNFRKGYGEEAYAVLSSEWITAKGLSPSLFNLEALQADLAAL